MPQPDTRHSAAPMHGLMPEGQAMLKSPARAALRQAAAALDRAEQFHQPLEMALALAQMARCYRGLQAPGPAGLYLERALAWANTLGAIDQSVEILCLLAETSCSLAEQYAPHDTRRRHAARERARDRVFEIAGLAGHVARPYRVRQPGTTARSGIDLLAISAGHLCEVWSASGGRQGRAF